MFKNLVRTTEKPPHFAIAKIIWLRVFKEVTAVYTEKRTKPIKMS
jgi:hypothetical protein